MKLALPLALILALAPAATADTIILKKGKKITGVVVSRNDGSVVVINPFNSRHPEMSWEIPEKNRIPAEKVAEVIAVGPPIMMKFCAKVAEEHGAKVLVSLNPIMIDGTGMCGGCRVTLGDDVKFACVDGPCFDGTKIDWDEMMTRLGAYEAEERVAMDHWCRIREGAAAEGRQA